jgi:hypothetical protein
MITEPSNPTLWPQGLNDEVRMKLEALEKENSVLKELVVRLSETVLRNLPQGRPINLSKNSGDH